MPTEDSVDLSSPDDETRYLAMFVSPHFSKDESVYQTIPFVLSFNHCP